MVDSHFNQKQQVEVKNALMFTFYKHSFSLHRSLIDDSYMWIIVMFLSAVWTLTAPIHDPLVSKWCNAKFLLISSDE